MRKVLLLAAAFALTASAAAAAGNATNGKTVFGRCAICHTTNKGGSNGLGPNLFGITGRKAAALANYSYSGPMKRSGITWTNDKLKQWIQGPSRMVPGTKMAFGGISNSGQADDLVAYLGTLK